MTKRVLVVDDRGELRRLVRLTLDHTGYEIAEAADGDAALAVAGVFRPHLVLLDVMMPGNKDGYEVCRRIRLDPDLAGTRVIMLTARGQETDRARGSEAGADAYVVKPFSPLALVETVTRLLDPASVDA